MYAICAAVAACKAAPSVGYCESDFLEVNKDCRRWLALESDERRGNCFSDVVSRVVVCEGELLAANGLIVLGIVVDG